MNSSCSIPGCKNKPSEKKYSFHAFPKHKFYRDKWLNVCRLQRTQAERICSLHFRPECFIPGAATEDCMDQKLTGRRKSRLRLKPTAIPTENVPKGPLVIFKKIVESEFSNEYLPKSVNNNSLDNCSLNQTLIRREINDIQFENEHLPERMNTFSKGDLPLEMSNVSSQEICELETSNDDLQFSYKKLKIMNHVPQRETLQTPNFNYACEPLNGESEFVDIVSEYEMTQVPNENYDIVNESIAEEPTKFIKFASEYETTQIPNEKYNIFNDAIMEELSEFINLFPQYETLQEPEENYDIVYKPEAEDSSECTNYLPAYETSQISNVNYSFFNEPDDEEPSELFNLIDRIFAPLPECNFSKEDERIRYFKHLGLIKKKINIKMLELQNNVEEERREKDRKLKQIEILENEKRNQHNRLVTKCLELKKQEIYWRKECLAYKIKLYNVKNKA